MKQRSLFLMALLVAVPMLGSCGVEKSDLDIKKISRSVAYSLPVFHLNQLPMDENIATNAFNLFIDSLDISRSYYLQSDIDTFTQESDGLAKRLRKGDISFATRAYETLLVQIENRMAFTEALLEKGFDTSIDETFRWDRQEAKWAETEVEWDELWRKRIKNEYIARLVSQQVYANEDAVNTNTVDSAETIVTNIVADVPIPSRASQITRSSSRVAFRLTFRVCLAPGRSSATGQETATSDQ